MLHYVYIALYDSQRASPFLSSHNLLRTLGCPDKPQCCLEGDQSPCPRHCQVKQKRPVAGQNKLRNQTSKLSPWDGECSRLWDTGVNKRETVLPSRQFSATLDRWRVQWECAEQGWLPRAQRGKEPFPGMLFLFLLTKLKREHT